jgi:uncharacterized membrane protein YraQ (UPF0718 family)
MFERALGAVLACLSGVVLLFCSLLAIPSLIRYLKLRSM